MSKKQEKKKSDFYDAFPNKIIRELLKTGKEKQVFAKEMGVSDEAVRQWINGYAQPGVKKLIDIANYFNVSMDFLFGITDVSGRDIEMQKFNEMTGLSENTIKRLTIFKDATEFTDLINFLFENDFLLEFSLNIKRYEVATVSDEVGSEYELHSQIEYIQKLLPLTDKVQKLNEKLSNDDENKDALSHKELGEINRFFEGAKKFIKSHNDDVSIINHNNNIPINKSIVATDEAKQIALWRISRLSEKIAEEYVKSKR